MLYINAQPSDQERMELSDVDEELMILVAVGLTDDEIATHLQIPKHKQGHEPYYPIAREAWCSGRGRNSFVRV